MTTGPQFVTVLMERGARKGIIDNVFADKYGGSNMSEGVGAEEPERSEELMPNPWGNRACARGCCRRETYSCDFS